MGGPIIHNRTFFFADYQGIRLTQPQTATSTIPTLALRQAVQTGDFSALGTAIYHPSSTATAANGTVTRNPFTNNVIPQSLLDPVAGRIVALLPEAAKATYLGTQEARRGLMLSLISDVATAYFELVELDRRLGVAGDSRDAFRATDKLFAERYGAGIVSKLQVTRAESALAAAEGTVYDIERQIG